jgi:ubiquinone/menaquinone biosynthesis C-methylase UbiE
VHRLLRPTGRAALLDFNRPEPGTFPAALQRFCLRQVVVPAAGLAGLREHYAYLEDSLARFPTGLEQVRLARQAGFRRVNHRLLAGGLMGLLELEA